MKMQFTTCRKTQFVAGLFISSILGALIILSGCTNEPIFAAIEQEVKLKDPTMRGTVTSLVSAGSNIYATNGQIYKKTGGAGNWNEFGSPDFRCAELASDGTNLYGIFQNENFEITSLQKFDGSGWTAVTGISGIQKIGSGNGRIYAFTGSGSSWDVYITPNAGSTSLTAVAIATGLSIPVGSAGDYFATTTGVYRYDSVAVAAGFPTSGIKGITVNSDGSSIYIVDAGSVYRYDGNAWSTYTHSVGSPTGIAYLSAGGKKLLLISGAKGYGEITLGATDEMTGYLNPGTSAVSSISTEAQAQYSNSIAQWNLSNIFAVTTNIPGNSYVIYAGIIDTRYDGLWAYYSDTQTEWNRE